MLFLLFTLVCAPTVQAITQSDLDSIIQNTPFYDPESEACSSAPISTTQTIFVIGDSLTVGMRDNGDLSGKLEAKGWVVKGVEATVGDTVAKALQKIDGNTEAIKASDNIVVALGTNPENNFYDRINELVTKLRGISPDTQISWMNAYSLKNNYEVANATLIGQSVTMNFKIIDWKAEALSKPATYPFAGDGIHHTTEGYKTKADFLVQSIAATNQTASISTDLLGVDNVEKSFRFFLQKGLSAAQSAGIVGNLMQESGVNPSSVSGSGYTGIAQWDKNGRWARLVEWARSQNKDEWALETQLDYLWKEASERGNIDGIKQQTEIDYAAWYWGRYFEVAIIGGSHSETPLTNVQALENRINNAKSVFSLYSGLPPPTQTGDCSASTGTGQDTRFIDGFTIYSQGDPAWKNLPYSSSTIGASGCGPSAMAMIITALTGQSVTPVDTANYAGGQDLYIPGQGSKWSIWPVLAEHWGLRAEAIGADLAKITTTLQAGGLVIAEGNGASPFTSGGHFIVIRAVTAEGKFRVGDSGHRNTSDQDWDPAPIISNMHGGSVYAITK